MPLANSSLSVRFPAPCGLFAGAVALLAFAATATCQVFSGPLPDNQALDALDTYACSPACLPPVDLQQKNADGCGWFDQYFCNPADIEGADFNPLDGAGDSMLFPAPPGAGGGWG